MKAIRSEARGEFYAFDPFLVDAVKCVLLRDSGVFTPQVASTKQLALPFPRLKRISKQLITQLLAFLLVRLVHFGVDLVQHRNQSMGTAEN